MTNLDTAPEVAPDSAPESLSEQEGLPRCWQPPARELVGDTFADDVRPWNWLELGEQDAEKLWVYLESFVAFFNARYGDHDTHRIPPCWPEHGALVEEVTTLAFARWQAFCSIHASIGGAQYFHSYTLPAFYGRLEHWLGVDLLRCQQGHHRQHPEIERDRDEQWQERAAEVRDGDLWLRCGTSDQRRGPGRASFVPYVERQPR